MKKVDLKEFAGIVAENEDLEKEIKSLNRPGFSEMKRIASRYGFELSLDSDSVRNDVAEMSVDELEHVAGGASNDSGYDYAMCKWLAWAGYLDPALCE